MMEKAGKLNHITWKTYLYILFIYVLIFLQYPIGVAIGELVFNVNLTSQVDPGHLIIWGAARMFLILPLLFTLLSQLEGDHHSIFLQMGEKNKMLSLTFWGTLAFTVLGVLLYPQFIHQTGLTFFNLLYLLPIFTLFAISNAFVEETFFRGAALSILTHKYSFFVANTIQAVFFAGIHFFFPVSVNLYLFVLLTFFLGLFWGWLTRSTKSLIPAIVLHIVADYFVAISLF